MFSIEGSQRPASSDVDAHGKTHLEVQKRSGVWEFEFRHRDSGEERLTPRTVLTAESGAGAEASSVCSGGGGLKGTRAETQH